MRLVNQYTGLAITWRKLVVLSPAGEVRIVDADMARNHPATVAGRIIGKASLPRFIGSERETRFEELLARWAERQLAAS